MYVKKPTHPVFVRLSSVPSLRTFKTMRKAAEGCNRDACVSSIQVMLVVLALLEPMLMQVIRELSPPF
jgi:hypothetical protein